MKTNLTSARKKRLRPKAEYQTIWDGKTPHFGIRIRSNGSMRYIHVIVLDGKMKKTTLGDVQIMSLNEARACADELNKGISLPPPPVSPLFKGMYGGRNAPRI